MARLTAKAVSPEAAALVDRITALVEGPEARGRRRGAEQQAKLRRGVEAFLGNLLLNRPKLTFAPTHGTNFTDMDVSARNFRAAVSGIERAGLIGRQAHFRSTGSCWPPGDAMEFGHSWAPRFWPSGALLEMASALGVLAEPDRHFDRPPPPVTRKRCVVLRELGKGSGRGKGQRLRLPGGPDVERLRDEVMEVNAALASAAIEGCPPPALLRSFTLSLGSGGGPALHGRWYAPGEGSFQQMSKEQRRGITIGGEPVAEADVSASQFWCVYGAAQRLGFGFGVPARPTPTSTPSPASPGPW